MQKKSCSNLSVLSKTVSAKIDPSAFRNHNQTLGKAFLPWRTEITGFTNPKVKFARSLREKKHRKREKMFLAEGLRIMTEALDAGVVPFSMFVAIGQEHPVMQRLEDAVVAEGGEVIETIPDVLEKLTGKSNPQAVIGIYEDHPTPLEELDRSSSNILAGCAMPTRSGQLGYDLANRRCSGGRRLDIDR